MAASWRSFLMPLDAVKTTLQVEGKSGIKLLKNKEIPEESITNIVTNLKRNYQQYKY